MSGIVIVVVMVKHGGVTSQQTASDSGHSWSFSEDSPSVHCKAFHSALKPPFSPSRFAHCFPVHGLSVSTPNVTIPLVLLCARSSLSYLQNRNRGKRSAFKVLIPPTSWASVSITLVPWERHPPRPVSLSIWPPPVPRLLFLMAPVTTHWSGSSMGTGSSSVHCGMPCTWYTAGVR